MKKSKDKLYRFLRKICKYLLKILYRPKFIGKENIPDNGPIIFAGNHKHAVDPVLVITSTKRVVHYMAKEELFKGLHGYIFSKVGLIKVHRQKSNPLAIIEAEKILNNGGTIGIFPEGTRNKSEDKMLLKFRHGAVAIAQNTNSLIVPFVIKGKYKLFRKGVTLEYGKPIDVHNMELEEANKYLESTVLKLLKGEK